jgi:hypothetical protein
MSCGRLENESTKRWLERLVGQGASDEQLGAVRDLLALEGIQLMLNERRCRIVILLRFVADTRSGASGLRG